MKKIFKTIYLIIIVFLISACAKEETIMTINKDKSMVLEVNIGYPISSNKELSVEEVKQRVENRGYSVDSYHDENFRGYKLSKQFKNINKVSIKENKTVNLATIINENFDDTSLFHVKKGFFKNTYTANFTYDFRNFYDYRMKIYLFGEETEQKSKDLENAISQFLYENAYDIELVKYNVLSNPENSNLLYATLNEMGIENGDLPIVIIGNKAINGQDIDAQTKIENEIKSMIKNHSYTNIVEKDYDSSYELTFQVNLPTKAITNNASSISNDGKTLVWNAYFFEENPIDFSFSIFNKSSIFICILFLFLVILFLFLSIVFYKKQQKEKMRFIVKNTNISSISPQIDDQNQITYINDLFKK